MRKLRYTFRNLKRNPLLTFVSIPGLAIGLAAVLLLIFYIRTELSYDQHFTTKDQVLRLYARLSEQGGSGISPINLRDAYTVIPEKIPEIEAATQIYRGWTVTVKNGNDQFTQQLLYADPGFFDVFGLDLLLGDKATALSEDKKVVLNVSTAQKIFHTTNCVGKMLNISDKMFTVSGVVPDLPRTTHFNMEMLISMETIHPETFGGLEFFTYFLIHKGADVKSVGAKIAAINNEVMKDWGEHFDIKVESGTELLSRIHLHSKVDYDLSAKASPLIIMVVGAIAFFIMLIALINYINLYVLHGEKRIAEIATRKSLGATSKTLASIFYLETGILVVISFLLALMIAVLLLPGFSQLIDRSIPVEELFTPSGIFLIAGILVVLVLLSGAYPSLYLSGIELVNGLKGEHSGAIRKTNLSAMSVLVQFSITVFLITSLLVISSQVSFVKSLPLGFNDKKVLCFDNLGTLVPAKYKAVQEELSQLSFVESVGSSFHSMGSGFSGQGIRPYGSTGNYQSINQYRVQTGYCETMQLQLKEGRFFRDTESDKKAVVLNEAAVKMLGIKKPVGQLVDMFGEPMKIIGVVKNFYYEHPGQAIAPLVLNDYSNQVLTIAMRTKGEVGKSQKTQIEDIFHHYDPDLIVSRYWLSDSYKQKFSYENSVMKLVSAGTYVIIIISFMGLMALSILNVNRRTKEIGIRKVAGSSVSEILRRLLSQTVVLVIISFVVAVVPVYFAMNYLLSMFAEHIRLHVGYFIAGGIFALAIALLAVSWQSWKAATRNPVEALRYE